MKCLGRPFALHHRQAGRFWQENERPAELRRAGPFTINMAQPCTADPKPSLSETKMAVAPEMIPRLARARQAKSVVT